MEPEDPQGKAYRISFTRCSIERCRGRRRKPQDSDAAEPPDASKGNRPGEPEP